MRLLILAFALVASTSLLAQGTTPPPATPPSTTPPTTTPPADPKKDDKKKADEKKPAEGDVAVPPLPPPADAPPTTPPGDVTAPPPGDPQPPSTQMSAEEIAKLKAQIKAELEAELKAQLQNEMEAAARDAATQRAAAQEWEEEKWVEEVKPTLNFLEFDGYFRTRFDLFNRLDLGTFDPGAGGGVGRGTSSVPPPTMYRPFDGQGCVDGDPANFPGDQCQQNAEDTATLLSMNMRLRLDPTLNISDDIRIKSTIDVLDNLVYGSTPESLPGFANNPTLPLPLFAASQNAPQGGLNAITDAIRIKRLWAEVMTPLGQLRFGRMPQHFGLGLLANDGNKLDSDYGDNADQIIFATRIAGHYIVPGYSWSSSGPYGRGGGAGIGGDGNLSFYAGENGQRYNLDPRDDVHSIVLVVAKRDKEEDITEQLRNGGIVVNYGLFGVYRTQQFDVPSYYARSSVSDFNNPIVQPEEYIRRDANAGIASLWGRFQWDKLKVEAEAVGIAGVINGTATVSGDGSFDPDLRTVGSDGELVNKPLTVLQGGFAIETSYKLLNDQLTVGLDGGVASGDDAFGFGVRPVINQQPQPGDFDGKQYGQCLERGNVRILEEDQNGDGDTNDPGEFVDCINVDDNITNFKFDPDYQVDLILFREILGTVTDALYVKPHIAYNLTENLGARADVIYSHALLASSTPSVEQNSLGLEVDLTGYYGTDDGFYLMTQYGFMLPFGGFGHFVQDEANPPVNPKFLTPQIAQTFQVYGGVQF